MFIFHAHPLIKQWLQLVARGMQSVHLLESQVCSLLYLAAEAFMTGLSSAMFDMHSPDIEELKARLVREGTHTPEEVERLPNSFFKKR